MLDPEITCQADNIRPELIRECNPLSRLFFPRRALPSPGIRMVSVSGAVQRTMIPFAEVADACHLAIADTRADID
jgi:hypothetical protein